MPFDSLGWSGAHMRIAMLLSLFFTPQTDRQSVRQAGRQTDRQNVHSVTESPAGLSEHKEPASIHAIQEQFWPPYLMWPDAKHSNSGTTVMLRNKQSSQCRTASLIPATLFAAVEIRP